MKRNIADFILRATSVVLMVTLWSLSSTAPAQAADCTMPLNGTYTAFSDGQWASTKYSYHDEASVTTRWTVTTTCADYLSCTGQVSSDQGWSGPAICKSGMWTVTHDVPDWERCPDGTAATGQQKFTFSSQSDPTRFQGWDRTLGPSGACGVNAWLIIEMPFTLGKLE
jgi:hypothetical protein